MQRSLLRYHVDDPVDFFETFLLGGADRPDRQARPARRARRSRRTTCWRGRRDHAAAAFQLTSALVGSRTAHPLVLCARPAPTLRPTGRSPCCKLPSDTQTLGPQQVQSQFISSPTVSSNISLLTRGQTAVDYGNLLTLPVAGGLLYVEPIYIERTGRRSYPQLAKVLVLLRHRIGHAPPQQRAGPGVRRGRGHHCAQPRQQPNSPRRGGAPGSEPAHAAAAAAAAIQTAITQLKAAQPSGDFAAQGQALAAPDAAVKQVPAGQRRRTPAAPAPPTARLTARVIVR